MSQRPPTRAAQAKRPGPFYGWYIVAASIAANALITGAFYQGFQAFFLPVLNTFGWSRTAISGAFSLRQVETGIAAPAVGLLVDRLGPRRLIMLGAIVMGLGLMGLSQTRNLPMFYLFFVVISTGASGLGHGVTWPTLVARWFRRRRGVAMGIATSGPVIGAALVVPNVVLAGAYGWRPMLFGYGVLVLASAPLLNLVVRDRPEHSGYLPDGAPPAPLPAPGQPVRRSSPEEAGCSVRQVIRTREFWVLMLFFGTLFIGNSGFQTHQIAYFESVGFSPNAAAATVVLVTLASGLGRLGAGTLADFLDYRLVMAGATLVMSSSFLYLALVSVDSFALSLPFTLLFGVGFGSAIPLRSIISGLLFGTRSFGAIIGLIQGSVTAAGVIGPVLMGYVFDTTGAYHNSFWALASISLLGLPLLAMLPRRPQQ